MGTSLRAHQATLCSAFHRQVSHTWFLTVPTSTQAAAFGPCQATICFVLRCFLKRCSFSLLKAPHPRQPAAFLCSSVPMLRCDLNSRALRPSHALETAGWHAKAEWHVLRMITVSFPAPKGVFRAGKATTCSGRPPSPPLQFLLPAWVTAHTSHLAAMAALQVITKQELDCTSMHMRAAALSHLP